MIDIIYVLARFIGLIMNSNNVLWLILTAIDSQFERYNTLYCSMIYFSMEWFANWTLYCPITYLDSLKISNKSIKPLRFKVNLWCFSYDRNRFSRLPIDFTNYYVAFDKFVYVCCWRHHLHKRIYRQSILKLKLKELYIL